MSYDLLFLLLILYICLYYIYAYYIYNIYAYPHPRVANPPVFHRYIRRYIVVRNPLKHSIHADFRMVYTERYMGRYIPRYILRYVTRYILRYIGHYIFRYIFRYGIDYIFCYMGHHCWYVPRSSNGYILRCGNGYALRYMGCYVLRNELSVTFPPNSLYISKKCPPSPAGIAQKSCGINFWFSFSFFCSPGFCIFASYLPVLHYNCRALVAIT